MSAAPPSIAHTLRHRAFRGLLGGGLVYFIGGSMQAMAASWLMLELTASAFWVSLVQTAVFGPMFLLSLPAGVLADITDRATLLQRAYAVQAAVILAQALLLLSGIGGAASLLLLTFASGCCAALMSPAWNTTVADAVPRDELPQAITAVGIAYNAARALGPTLAGAVIAVVGGPWVFMVSCAAALVMLAAVRRHPPRPHPPSRLPPERLWQGSMAGLRFARHSQPILAQLLRTMAYGGTGAALWALLPVIGQRQLGLGAAGFGLMMGCLGLGAVGAGLALQRLRVRRGVEFIVSGGCIVFALAMLVAAWSRLPAAVYLALVAGGAAWMSVMSTFNAATQTSAPPWVRSRAAALHALAALGAFAIGSALWGALSGVLGLPVTLSIAAAAMFGGLLLARPLPVRMGEAQDVTPAVPFEELFVVREPDPEAGPVAVEIVYRIAAADADAFLDAAQALRAPRQRDGATFWRVYRDLGDPTRYVERFIVASWADYLHQRNRATLADQELEALVRSFQLEGVPVQMQHFIAER